MKSRLLIILAVICAGLFASCTVYVEKPVAHGYTRPAPEFYVMRIYDNTYIFYDGNEPVASWTFNDDGTVIKQGDEITGIVKVFYDNGYLFSETYYSNGIRDGLCRQYYPDGTLMYSGYYSMGYRHGNWRSYAFSGNGQILGTFDFSGRGEEPPAQFNPQLDEKVRIAYEMMMLEDHYANKPVIKRDFNPADANPTDYGRRFGAAPPKEGMKPGDMAGRHVNIGAEIRRTQEIKPSNRTIITGPQSVTHAVNQAVVNQQPAAAEVNQAEKSPQQVTFTVGQGAAKTAGANNKKAAKAAKPRAEAKNAPAKVTGRAKAQVPKKENVKKPKAEKHPAAEEKKTPEENIQKHDKEK